jgi:hypothetical protein
LVPHTLASFAGMTEDVPVDMGRAARSALVWLRSPQPDPELTAAADDKRGPSRKLLYWTAAAALLFGFAIAAVAETHLDEVYDRGPLSASAVRARQITAFGSAAQVILRRCRSELVSGSPLKPPVAGMPWSYIVYGADPAQHLYACYERTPGDSFVIGSVLTSTAAADLRWGAKWQAPLCQKKPIAVLREFFPAALSSRSI